MSLRVWLPLDGDLKNQGLSNIKPVNTNGVFIPSGKIGSCLEFQQNGYVEFPYPITTNISFCCWVKFLYLDNNDIHIVDGRGPSGYGYQPICVRANRIQYGGSGSDYYNISYSFATNRWYHIAITHNASKGSCYIDGEYVGGGTATKGFGSGSGGVITLGARYTHVNNAAADMNDFRIYDHCLSAAEIKEIAQGLVLHYKLDNNSLTGRNLLLGTEEPKEVTLSSDNAYTSYYYFDTNCAEQVTEGATLTVSYDYEVDTSNVVDTEPSMYSQLNGSAVTPRDTFNVLLKPRGRHVGTFVVTAAQAEYTSSFRLRIRLYTANEGITFKIWNVKLEVGDKATGYSPAYSDLPGYDSEHIVDSSGYGHHGVAVNNPQPVSNTMRYTSSTSFNGTDQCIRAGRAGMLTDAITVNLWGYRDTWPTSPGSMISCTQSGGWNFENNSSRITFQCGTGTTANTYQGVVWTNHPFSSLSGGWHMFTGSYDGFATKLYVDGELAATNEAYTSKTPLFYNSANGIFIGAEAGSNQTTPAGTYFTGNISDVRIYATALSADDILELYHTSAKIDNLGGVYTFELIEGEGEHITKEGLIETGGIYENGYQSILQYDKNIYTEPDGSTWVHVFHHNNPSNGRFSNSTADWSNGIYIDANRWYDVEKMLYNLVKYEFMVKQKTTSDATETKWRWVQNINPMDATWATVGTDACVYNTSSGYATSSYKKGMYIFKTSNLHMCIANNSNGNWYGGIGAVDAFNGGIPGYPNTTVTTGYIDLYIRVYLPAKIIKNTGFSALEFIEK